MWATIKKRLIFQIERRQTLVVHSCQKVILKRMCKNEENIENITAALYVNTLKNMLLGFKAEIN